MKPNEEEKRNRGTHSLELDQLEPGTDRRIISDFHSTDPSSCFSGQHQVAFKPWGH